MKTGYSENVTVDEGTFDGVNTQLHFEGDYLITQRTYDAEPHLQYAKDAREQTAGKRWGDGRLIFHIPPAEYALMCGIQDPDERKKYLHALMAAKPLLKMF